MRRFKSYILIGNSLLILFIIIYFFTINKYPDSAYISMSLLIEELPMIERNYSVKIKIGNDSVLAFFDTGMSNTEFLLSKVTSKTGKTKSRSNIYGERVFLKSLSFESDTLYLGNTKFVKNGEYNGRDSSFNNDRSILGTDIFKHFVWKLDHIHQKILFSQDSSAFSGNHLFSIPFTFSPGGSPCINATINGKKYLLLFDTGYSGFIHIKDESVKNTINWNTWTSRDYLNEKYLQVNGDSYKNKYLITNLDLKKVNFNDEVIKYNQFCCNLIGQDFCKRFEYVIIDYLHQVIHFGPMHYKSYFYLLNLRERINSIGIETNAFISPPQIIGVSEKMEKAGICLGDTIVKIDGLPVSENPDLIAFSTLENPAVPPTSLAYLQYITDEAVITIKKNGKEQDFRLQREHYVNEPDTVVAYEGGFLQTYPIYKSIAPVAVDTSKQVKKESYVYKGPMYMRYINNKK